MKKIFISFFLFTVCSVFVFAQLPSDVLDLRVENSFFSPNKDGLNDNLFFRPILKSEWNVSRWRLEIESESGQQVYRATGAGFTTLIPWNGTDRKENLLPEGSYQATMSAWGPGFKVRSDVRKVLIDNTPPLVELSVSSAAGGGSVLFHPRVQEANVIDRWMIQVMDLNGRTLDVIWSSGSVQDVAWPDLSRSTRPVSLGSYKAVLQAWDRAENESAPVFADFSLVFSGDRSVRSSLKSLHINETSQGLLIQLNNAALFNQKGGKPQFKKSAEVLLDEVSLLATAYPHSEIRLDGYSFSRPNSAADRDLSSRCAWMVYSHLVKKDSLPASRITVRGRGRIFAEGREKISPLVLKNGVEIWLLGPGPW
jgi:flagellar motor protein MotB